MGLVNLSRMTSDSGTQDNINRINQYAVGLSDITDALDGNKNATFPVAALTSNTTIDDTYAYKTIELDSSGGSFTCTLDSTNMDTGWWCKFKDSAGYCTTNKVIISGGGDNIDDSTGFDINGDYNVFCIEWDGTQFIILNYNENGLNIQDGVYKWRRNFALGSGSNNKWFKIATITIDTRYQGCILNGHVMVTNGTSDEATQSEFMIHFKQQNVMSSDQHPEQSLYLRDSGYHSTTYPYIRAFVSQDDTNYKILDIYAYSYADFAVLYFKLEASNAIIAPASTTPTGVSEATMEATGTEISNMTYYNMTTDYSASDYLITPNDLYIDQNLLYATDATYSFGDADNKCSEVFSDTGTINTSDPRKKNVIDIFDDSAKRNKAMWFIDSINLNMVTMKSSRNPENPRRHFALMTPDIINNCDKLGLTSDNYAGYIKKDFTRKIQKTDRKGNLVYKTETLEVEIIDPKTKQIIGTEEVKRKTPVMVEESDYFEGLRYNQILLLLIPYCQELNKKIADLEQKVRALEPPPF